jgi:hypothetical protein
MFGHQFAMAFMQRGEAIEVQSREQCPACSNTALLDFVNIGERDCPKWAATSLRCAMCHLELGSRDELRAAGFDLEAADNSFTVKLTRYLINKDGHDEPF